MNAVVKWVTVWPGEFIKWHRVSLTVPPVPSSQDRREKLLIVIT